MNKKIIGLDLDGVIIDHAANKIKAAKSLGIDLDILDTPSDILKKKFAPELSMKISRMIYDDPAMTCTAPLMPGAETGLEKLKAQGHKYFLISRQKNPPVALESLKVHGLWPKYFNDHNTFFVKDSDGKNQKAIELGVDMYIDDQPGILAKLSVAKKFLFDPLGVYEDTDWYHRVRNWPEFLRSVDL